MGNALAYKGDHVKSIDYYTQGLRIAEAENDSNFCLLYTSDAADERSSVDLGGRRIIQKNKKKNKDNTSIPKVLTVQLTTHKP